MCDVSCVSTRRSLPPWPEDMTYQHGRRSPCSPAVCPTVVSPQVKKQRKQLDKVLCGRCSELCNGAMIPAVQVGPGVGPGVGVEVGGWDGAGDEGSIQGGANPKGRLRV